MFTIEANSKITVVADGEDNGIVVVNTREENERVLFAGAGSDMGGKTVSLSRVPDHCYFTSNNLQAHDGHAPRMHSKEELAAYKGRVIGDLVKNGGADYDVVLLLIPKA